MRSAIVIVCALSALTATAAPCAAQGFGVGGRVSMVRSSVESGTSSARFLGGLLKVPLSPRSGLEVSLDRRTDSNDDLTERVVETPLQLSLMLYPVRSTFSPYLLGGVGWYRRRVETLDAGTVTLSETSRKFGYHAGLGAEILMGRRFGLHGDYRYTFVRFGDDDDGDDSFADRLKPSHEGSMWTAGLTVYF